MFERFTERARQVVVLAQDESRRLGHPHIGTEHLLLGLLREHEGIAARALEGLEITLEEVRKQVERIVGRGDPVTTGQIPFTPGAKQALELSLGEAVALGHEYIGTEHLLLGLARANDDVTARILRELGADPDKIRDEVTRTLSGTGGPQRARSDLEHVELTSPPLAPEVLAALERLAAEKQTLIDGKQFEDAARLAGHEHGLRVAAAELVRAWQHMIRDP